MYDILHTMNHTVSNVLLQKVQEPLYIVVIYSFFLCFWNLLKCHLIEIVLCFHYEFLDADNFKPDILLCLKHFENKLYLNKRFL